MIARIKHLVDFSKRLKWALFFSRDVIYMYDVYTMLFGHKHNRTKKLRDEKKHAGSDDLVKYKTK